MLNLKSHMGKGLAAVTVALSLTVAGVVVLDAGPAHAGHKKSKSKKTSTRQNARAQNTAKNNQSGEANGGRCVNVSPAVGGVSVAPAVIVLGQTLIQIPVAAADGPDNTGNQTCHGGANQNQANINQGSLAANNATTNG